MRTRQCLIALTELRAHINFPYNFGRTICLSAQDARAFGVFLPPQIQQLLICDAPNKGILRFRSQRGREGGKPSVCFGKSQQNDNMNTLTKNKWSEMGPLQMAENNWVSLG